VGDNPEPHPGIDLSSYAAQGYGLIVRLQYSWGGGGTFPLPAFVIYYLERVRTCVLNSRGVHIWQVGNEWNHPQEQPRGSDGYYAPGYVAGIYSQVRAIIHSIPGHESDEVLFPPCAPWVNLNGMGWVESFQASIAAMDGREIDGFALHTYSRGSDPASITSQAKMGAPYEEYYNGWPTLYDWLHAIPEQYRSGPCYLTETNQINDPPGWSETNTGWVTAMYSELNRHNVEGTEHKGELLTQTVRCGLLYRWPHYDDYGISGNTAIVGDFRHARTFGYKWGEPIEPPEEDTLLLNPSFEGEWYNQTPDGILVLPEHWAAEYHENDDPYKRPEIKPNEEFATDGRFSIRAFPPEHSRGFYGIYQDVEAEPGQWYRFSADVRVESDPPGKLGAFVGIQPWGGSIKDRQMIWGEEIVNSHDWTRIEVYAQAFGGRIRVAMGADNEYSTRNNTTWWDNARLELWDCDGGGTEPPVEPPEPGECAFDAEAVRRVVREELDKTVWASGAG
jgi:hypothetical protein